MKLLTKLVCWALILVHNCVLILVHMKLFSVFKHAMQHILEEMYDDQTGDHECGMQDFVLADEMSVAECCFIVIVCQIQRI